MAKLLHRSGLSILSACGVLAAATAGLTGQTPALRTWTDSQSRKIEATYSGLQGENVLLKLSDGKTVVPYPLMKLSPEDQAFIKSQGIAPATPPTPPDAITPKTGAAKDAARLPIPQRTWPTVVEVPAKAIEVNLVSEDPRERKYVYQSEFFEFSSQAKVAGSVMKEVARTFEATRSLVRALPWGIACQPPNGLDRFKAALYETRSDYIAAGGPELSGGLYDSGEKIFKIPFPSLGLEKRGQTYFKKDFTNDTLVHEITHQMMDDYLPFLPVWMIEGCAEYTRALPYKVGIFRAEAHKSGLKELIGTWRQPADIDELEKHITMTRSQWATATATAPKMAEMYHRSYLLVYYFCHLDGDKKGTRFLRYLEAVYADVAALRTFMADPRVKQLGGGRFSYPSDMGAPPMPSESSFVKHLPLLLEERSYAKLATEITEGFKTIGVKVSAR